MWWEFFFICAKSKLQAGRSSRVFLSHSLVARSVTCVLDRGKKVYSINSLRSIARETQSVFLRRREQRYWMDVLGKWYDFRAIKLCALFQWRWVGAHDSTVVRRYTSQHLLHTLYACNRISWFLLSLMWGRRDGIG